MVQSEMPCDKVQPADLYDKSSHGVQYKIQMKYNYVLSMLQRISSIKLLIKSTTVKHMSHDFNRLHHKGHACVT